MTVVPTVAAIHILASSPRLCASGNVKNLLLAPVSTVTVSLGTTGAGLQGLRKSIGLRNRIGHGLRSGCSIGHRLGGRGCRGKASNGTENDGGGRKGELHIYE